MAFDPDGDRVRCRYGLVRPECDRCDQPSGFYLDQVGVGSYFQHLESHVIVDILHDVLSR
jgi:hypothetical protein